MELQAGQIDHDGNTRQAGLLPQHVLFACSFDRPMTNRDNETGLLCQRDKFAGQNQSTLGVIPAQQRFVTDDFARLAVHQRLKIQDKFAALQRFSQTPLKIEFLQRGGVHRWIVEMIATAAGAFCMVHRRVRILN